MTERLDPPVPNAKRRRKATPPGHIEVAPASVGQGAQVEVATNATGSATRRTSRKRGAKPKPEAAEVAEAVATGISLPADEPPSPSVEAANGIERKSRTTTARSTPPAKPNARAAARRAKPAEADGVRAAADSPEIVSPETVAAAIAAERAAPTDVASIGSVAADAPAPGDAPPAAESPNQHTIAATPAMNDDAMPQDLALDAAAADDLVEAERAADETAAADPIETAASDAPDDVAESPSEPPSTDTAQRSSDPPPPEEPPHHHGWVYLALGVFALALLFGAWGVWNVFFAGGEDDARDAASLAKRNDSLRQEVATLRRSDQISREANRDLQRALAERDEEISGLRADVAFYERFVGATGQRRGLSVHDLEMQSQSEGTWHFVATLTQNLNRGAVNTGRLTVSVEGTRNDRLERLSWTRLRKQNNAPGTAYSFKYFQQVEGDLFLPADFKPVRVTVRLVPSGGAAVEQSFAWADTLDRSPVP